MADTLTVRLDDATRAALTRLTSGGVPASAAVRAALLEADRLARREALRREAAEIAADPEDRAEVARALEDLEHLRAW